MALQLIVKSGNMLVSLVVLVFVTKGVFAARGCPDGWVPFAHSCYLGLDGSMKGNWTNATMQCDRNNASIMVPSSDWENAFINNSLPYSANSLSVWINCNDAEVEGEWNCYEGGKYPTGYRKWVPDAQRPSFGRNYGAMITRVRPVSPVHQVGYWRKAREVAILFVVCERPRDARRGQSMNMYCMTID